MINTQEEYESALNFIDKELKLYDFELPEKMNSYVYNLYLQDIEYYLDLLYEKYRAIEDLCDYLENYADVKISKAIQDISDSKNKLEASLDKYNDRKYKVYAPEWNTTDKMPVYDRDGSVLNMANIDYKKTISPARTYGNNIFLPCATKTSDIQTYTDNLLTLVNDGYYITNYKLEHPTTIKEKIDFNIEPKYFKYIDFMPINCEITIEDKDKAEITLTANSMKKVKEDFNQDRYNKSALDRLNNTNCDFNSTMTLKDNYTTITEECNYPLKNDYINNAIKYQNNSAEAENESRLASERVAE